MYWDDAELPRELVIKPTALGEEMDWHWSGGFPIPETEWYFGLRIRHRENERRYINIPVNVTVGSSGARLPLTATSCSLLLCCCQCRVRMCVHGRLFGGRVRGPGAGQGGTAMHEATSAAGLCC